MTWTPAHLLIETNKLNQMNLNLKKNNNKIKWNVILVSRLTGRKSGGLFGLYSSGGIIDLIMQGTDGNSGGNGTPTQIGG